MARLLWLAVTLVVLLVIGLVPFLGWLISAWGLLAGMGGLTLAARARRGRRRVRRSGQAPCGG